MADDRRQPANDLPAPLRQQLDATRDAMLRVHKALLDHERLRYERRHGAVRNSGEFLQLVINDPWFNWLRLISELIVQIDELLASKEPVTAEDGKALLTQARDMLRPDEQGDEFRRNYHRGLQEDPAALMAHGEFKKAIA